MDLGSTTWRNPTEQAVVLRLYVSPGQHQKYEIPAGGTAQIPSQFSSGIHHVRDGQIVGGHAPQLVCEGQTETLHPGLRPSVPTAAAAASDKSRR